MCSDSSAWTPRHIMNLINNLSLFVYPSETRSSNAALRLTQSLRPKAFSAMSAYNTSFPHISGETPPELQQSICNVLFICFSSNHLLENCFGAQTMHLRATEELRFIKRLC